MGRRVLEVMMMDDVNGYVMADAIGAIPIPGGS